MVRFRLRFSHTLSFQACEMTIKALGAIFCKYVVTCKAWKESLHVTWVVYSKMGILPYISCFFIQFLPRCHFAINTLLHPRSPSLVCLPLSLTSQVCIYSWQMDSPMAGCFSASLLSLSRLGPTTGHSNELEAIPCLHCLFWSAHPSVCACIHYSCVPLHHTHTLTFATQRNSKPDPACALVAYVFSCVPGEMTITRMTMQYGWINATFWSFLWLWLKCNKCTPNAC